MANLEECYPEGTVLHLVIQLGGVTELCNQSTVECTTDDPTPLISQPFPSQAARCPNPTPTCHSKTLSWSLHSPASSPVTSSRATPHHSTTRLLACHFWPHPSSVIPKLHPSPVIPRPFLRLSLYDYTPSGKSAPPLPRLFPSGFC